MSSNERQALDEERVISPMGNLPQELIVLPGLEQVCCQKLTVLDAELEAFMPEAGASSMKDWMGQHFTGCSSTPMQGLWGDSPAENIELITVFGRSEDIKSLFGAFLQEVIRIGLMLGEQAVLITVTIAPKPKLCLLIWLR